MKENSLKKSKFTEEQVGRSVTTPAGALGLV